MVVLHTSAGAAPLMCDDYYIRELTTGRDELVLRVSIWDEHYSEIAEESLLSVTSATGPEYYRVKAMDGGNDTATVKALLDLPDWESGMILDYDGTGVAPGAILAANAPPGWTVQQHATFAATEEITMDGGTPLDLLNRVLSAYDGLAVRFDTAGKIMHVLDLYAGPYTGAFLMRDLNLKAVQYKGKSTGLVTRLYAYGKDGLSISSVNSGLPYIDNNTYSSRVISAYWRDERYEIPANLKAAAVARLASLAVPEQSFSCDVADLAAISPANHAALALSLTAQVDLIDTTRGNFKIRHRIVEYWRHPLEPSKNSVILSNSPRRIQTQVQKALTGPVDGERLVSGSVGGGKIGSGAVKSANLADNSVTVMKIKDGAVVTEKIQTDAVTAEQLRAGAVTVNKIANGAVISDKIATDAVTATKILNGSVTGPKVLDQAIAYAKLSGSLQVFYNDTIAANALFAGVIYAQNSVSCSTLIVNGTQYVGGGHISFVDGLGNTRTFYVLKEAGT